MQAIEQQQSSEARLDAFMKCGSDAWVLRSRDATERLKVVASNCHDRFCLPCAQERAATVRSNLTKILKERNAATNQERSYTHRFITLTIQTKPGELLNDSLNDLYRWFKALRASKLWTRCVRGGAAFCEIKWIEASERWHPHLHIITEGRYVPQDQLRELWRRITKTSHIVDIKALRDDDVVVRYVAKYASKPMNSSFSGSVELLTEAIGALKGRKLCHCFGTWTKYRLLKQDEIVGWEPIGRYLTLLHRGRTGDADAIHILSLLDAQKSTRDASVSAILDST